MADMVGFWLSTIVRHPPSTAIHHRRYCSFNLRTLEESFDLFKKDWLCKRLVVLYIEELK
jgi:hypothetical protein